jgi:nucleoredoxin
MREKIPRSLLDALGSLTTPCYEHVLELKLAGMQMDERAQIGAAAAAVACGVAVVLCCRTSDAQNLEEQRKVEGSVDTIERARQTETPSTPPPSAPVASPRAVEPGQEQPAAEGGAAASSRRRRVQTEEQGAAEGARPAHADESSAAGENPPLPGSMARHQLGGEVLSLQGASAPRTLVPTETALSDKKLVAVFFSARWSAPCVDFTPRLVKWYVETAAELHVEVVYVSCDVDEDGFVAHADKMPWLAVPYTDRQRATQLRTSLGVMSIPSVVLLGSDGFPQSHDTALRMLPGLPQVDADSEGRDTTSRSPARGLARLSEAEVQEYRLDGTTRAGKRIAGWHSREKPDKNSRAVRCYLDGAVIRASERGSWLQLEHGHGFLRREHWGAGWRSTTESRPGI